MLTRTTSPLLFTALLEPPCCRTFAFLNIGFANTADFPRLDASTPAATPFSQRPSARLLTSGCSSGSGPSLPPSSLVMARKRTWGKKKDERARSFAKRGRVGGWGDYSEATPKDEERGGGAATATADASPTRPKQQPQSRKVYEVHPGSYAGDLAETLSNERLQVLRKHLEQDDEAAQAQESLAPVESGGAADDDEDKPKKKVALLISYWGSNYQGLQINEGAQTIEAELEMAVYLAGAMSKDNFGNLRKVSWSRSGRTDKGVHAAAQLISLKLSYANDCERETIEALNGYLPEDIRVVDIKRAPKSFDARTRCSGRRYEYIMPTFVLAPKEHVSALFEEAIAWEKAQGGQGDKVIEDNAKVTEDDVLTVPPPPCIGRPSVCAAAAPTPCSAAAAGTVTVPPGDSVATGGAASAVSGDAQAGSPLGKRGGGRADDGTDDDGGEADAEDADAATKSWDTVELSSPAVVRRVAKELEGYRLPEGAVAALRETLEGFVGTKNYHNYTNHKKPTDPSCKRLVTSFVASEPFENNGMEWIRLTVEGQSFILHQIRKMVASSVDRVRGQSSDEDFTKTFFLVKMNLGVAPSQGLYLERPLYEVHNKHMKEQGAGDRALEWETGPAADALERFKTDTIHSGILAKENADHDFVAWLDRLIRYPCLY